MTRQRALRVECSEHVGGVATVSTNEDPVSAFDHAFRGVYNYIVEVA